MTAASDIDAGRFEAVLGVRRGSNRPEPLTLIDLRCSAPSGRRIRARFVRVGDSCHGINWRAPTAMVEVFDITDEPEGADVTSLAELGVFVRRCTVHDLLTYLDGDGGWSISEKLFLPPFEAADLADWAKSHRHG